jgi:hypothetical protein
MEIATRLDMPIRQVNSLISSALHYSDCKSFGELEAMFEPDWARIDGVENAAWRKVSQGRGRLRQ